MIWPWTKLDKPFALPSRFFPNKEGEFTWEDWEEQNKAKYPVRYFLQESFPKAIRRMFFKATYPFTNGWYWIRTHTYNRYHIIDLRCSGYGLEYDWGWIDRSEAMLIAPFQILKQFVEKEFKTGLTDWTYDEDIRFVASEIQSLYNWWTVDRSANWKAHYKKYDNTKREGYAILHDEQEALEKQDDINLKRLIKIRHYLWT